MNVRDSDPILIGRTWHFEDGTTLPLISGGSDTGPSGTNDSIPAPTFGSDGTDLPPQNPDSLVNPFLSKIPEADRNVVAPYIKDWDAGVTRRFQEIHQQYAPFKGMDAEEVQQAIAFRDYVNQNEEAVFQVLAERLGYEVGGNGPQQYQGGDEFENPWAEDGIPDEFARQFMELQQVNQALAQRVMGIDDERIEQQEDAELDSLLDSMHKQHGSFNDQYVLLQLSEGLTPEQAIASWHQMIQGEIDSRSSGKTPVPILGGNGTVPMGGVDPRKMKTEDLQAHIANVLSGLNNER